MTYNHEETKVRDPSAAREVERLRVEIQGAINEILASCTSEQECLVDLADHLTMVLGSGINP